LAQEREILDILRKELAENCIAESRISTDRPVVIINREALLQALRLLVEKFDSRFCTITAVDNGVDFELIYHMSIKGLVINVKTVVPKEESEVASVTKIIQAQPPLRERYATSLRSISRASPIRGLS
jgi:Ni,Fe-hydrogenase III component G